METDLKTIFSKRNQNIVVSNCIDIVDIFKVTFPFDKRTSLAHISEQIFSFFFIFFIY